MRFLRTTATRTPILRALITQRLDGRRERQRAIEKTAKHRYWTTVGLQFEPSLLKAFLRAGFQGFGFPFDHFEIDALTRDTGDCRQLSTTVGLDPYWTDNSGAAAGQHTLVAPLAASALDLLRLLLPRLLLDYAQEVF